MSDAAILALADGTVFRGRSIGAHGKSVGEVVFNTAMTGYQEILSDPSYSRQIVTLTCPHIGNTGTNSMDMESAALHCAGLVVRDVPATPSSWRMEEGLGEFLRRHDLVGLSDIDTRKLTRIIRDKGAQSGCLLAGDVDEDAAIAEARSFPGLVGMDLAQVVSTVKAYQWNEGSLWPAGQPAKGAESPLKVVAYDFGIKLNILRLLVDAGCAVTVVPAMTPADQVLALRPDGVFLSNGPGDPEPCDYAIDAIRELLANGVPTFGICLGHQLLALASGAKTIKMKFGHHGANHPVADLQSGQVLISSQNHGFAVDEATLPDTLRATHRSLFDGSLQGIERSDVPAYGFQGHPEASPGPRELRPMFERFVEMMSAGRSGKKAAGQSAVG